LFIILLFIIDNTNITKKRDYRSNPFFLNKNEKN